MQPLTLEININEYQICCYIHKGICASSNLLCFEALLDVDIAEDLGL